MILHFPMVMKALSCDFNFLSRGKCWQMQSQCEWVQSSLVFILGQSIAARLQHRPAARKGHKLCQLHSTTTSLLLWRAAILRSST